MYDIAAPKGVGTKDGWNITHYDVQAQKQLKVVQAPTIRPQPASPTSAAKRQRTTSSECNQRNESWPKKPKEQQEIQTETYSYQAAAVGRADGGAVHRAKDGYFTFKLSPTTFEAYTALTESLGKGDLEKISGVDQDVQAAHAGPHLYNVRRWIGATLLLTWSWGEVRAWVGAGSARMHVRCGTVGLDEHSKRTLIHFAPFCTVTVHTERHQYDDSV
jgi:hypothetical protein